MVVDPAAGVGSWRNKPPESDRQPRNEHRPRSWGSGAVGHGADRGRTDNLLDATEALSQLSYGPNSGSGLVPANHRGTAKCIDLPGGRPEPIT